MFIFIINIVIIINITIIIIITNTFIIILNAVVNIITIDIMMIIIATDIFNSITIQSTNYLSKKVIVTIFITANIIIIINSLFLESNMCFNKDICYYSI
jgi:hypothetical protein